ncbi:MAG: 4Fe-4S binding protein [Clostridiales bacterium]|nr:4Fe-4S binding protein [Clostridiales bacterium]
MKLIFDESKCIGCYTCHVMCIAQHNTPDKEDAFSYIHIKEVFDEKQGILRKICIGCTHCGICLEACQKKAIYRDDSGFVLVHKEKCVGCKRCQSICPNGVIRFEEDGKMQKCDACMNRLKEGREPACVSACCTGAIAIQH